MSDADQSTVEFYRLGDWQDRFRSYEILVDNNVIGSLAAKSSLTIEIQSGRRAMKARIGGQGSEAVSYDFASGKKYRVHVGPAPGLAARKSFVTDSWVLLTVEEPE